MAGAPESAAADPNKALILILERDPYVQMLERYFLTREGYTVEIVDDGAAGLERAARLRPAILITEILLPGLDGLTVCRHIKGHPETRGIAVLVFSVLASEDRAREAGADAFLRKPVDETQLVAVVARLLDGRQCEGS